MKKKLTVLAVAALMSGALTTTFAAENPTGGTTEVLIGVTKIAPKNIRVTVPTSLAIAVVDDGNEVKTLMGNYTVDGNGNITNSGDAAQGITDQRIAFVNTGEVSAKVVSAKITNAFASDWTIIDTPTKIFDMSMELDGLKVGTVEKNNNTTINFTDFKIDSNTQKIMKAKVSAFGEDGNQGGLYTSNMKSARSFVIEWSITEA